MRSRSGVAAAAGAAGEGRRRAGNGGVGRRVRIDATLSLGGSDLAAAGIGERMRTMFALYWVLIVGGLAIWIVVGLVID
jgi:hypothetical protein